MIVFQRESYSESLSKELGPLIQSHHKEISIFKDVPVEVDWCIYSTAEQNGSLRIFTARENGTLCGYAVFLVGKSPHFKDQIQAHQDSLFLAEEFRNGLTGVDFIRWCDEELQKEWINVVHQNVKVGHDFGAVLERLGYVLNEKIYSKQFVALEN